MCDDMQSPLIVGMDVSGDPKINALHDDIVRVLKSAKNKQLKIAAHIGLECVDDMLEYYIYFPFSHNLFHFF